MAEDITSIKCNRLLVSRQRRIAMRKLGVFHENRSKPIHRWYPFVEGYSADLVTRALTSGKPCGRLIDPFGGSGTTALAASALGLHSYFCEVNPYLAWMADVKVNVSYEASSNPNTSSLLELADALDGGFAPAGNVSTPLVVADARRGFFPPGAASEASGIIEWIGTYLEAPARELALVAVTSSLIPASNMIRRVDLRKRRKGDPAPVSLLPTVAARLRVIYSDVRNSACYLGGRATLVGSDVRQMGQLPEPVDLIITSPPYLNGTNYCRNTKLELLALGAVRNESELSGLRLASITAGINNVSRRRSPPCRIESVEEVAGQLDAATYDPRIPTLVRLYFSDMRMVFRKIRANAVTGARWFLDIGDSKFAGVHIPTPQLLIGIAEGEGWVLTGTETLRRRRSHDGSSLTQLLLELAAV